MTAAKVLDIARAEIGVKESPANSNCVKYNTWFYGKSVAGTAYPWCMAFVQWCFWRAGGPNLYKTASCNMLLEWFKANQPNAVCSKPRVGDIVIYTFGHTGIVESIGNGEFTAIEGNTSISGSQSNGGEVCRKTRKLYSAKAFLRPEYKKEVLKVTAKLDNTPSNAHKEAVEWAKANGILNGNTFGNLMLSQPVTRQQLCTILYNYHRKFGKKG